MPEAAAADAPKKVAIHLNHDPVTLRVDEMVPGEMGIPCAKEKFSFELRRGRNEVDAAQWAEWYEQNKAGPLVTGGIVTLEPEQEQEPQHDNQ